MATTSHLPVARHALGRVASSSRRWVIWRPLALVVLAVAAAVGALALDTALATGADDLVDADTARAFLASVAGTMVTATVVLFWIRGLIVGQHSGQLPARVLTSYLRDPYQQTVMGFMVAVLAFIATVLFGLPTATTDTGETPAISIALSALLLIAALLTIIQSIDTSTRSMHEERVLLHVVQRGLDVIRREYPEQTDAPPVAPPPPGDGVSTVVWGDDIGWVQAVDVERVLGHLPVGAVCYQRARTGEFVTPATSLCRVVVPVDHSADGDAKLDTGAIADAFALATTRSPEHDIAFALRSLVDVALAGLAAGGPDRTTAREAIAQLGALVRPLLLRDGPAPVRSDGEGRWVVLEGPSDFRRYTDEAFEDLRHADPDPVTVRLILGTIHDLIDTAQAAGRHERADILRRHVELFVEQVRRRAADDHELRWATREIVDVARA